MGRLSYLLWLSLFLLIPTAALWAFFHQTLQRHLHIFLINTALVLLGVVWDVWGATTGVWSFPAGRNLGYYLWGLPLEEYLAFIFFAIFVTSLAIVFRFHGHLRVRAPR